MKLIGFKTPKPRKYSYKPVFYDPVKEAQENRRKELDKDTVKTGDELRTRLRLRMNRKAFDERTRKRSRRMSVIIAVMLLLLILYYIFLG